MTTILKTDYIMENTQEKDLMDALAYTGCSKLPRAINIVKDQSRIWVKAIAKVHKITGADTYVVLKNDYGRRPVVIKTFGESSAIANIVSIHPFEWLQPDFIPKFKNDEDRDAFLARSYGKLVEKISALSPEDKDRLLYLHLMSVQAAYNNGKKF